MDSMPMEILGKIFHSLPVVDRIRVERVCKRWRNVSLQQKWKDVQVISIIRPKRQEQYSRFKDCADFDEFLMILHNKLYIGTKKLGIIQCVLSRVGRHIKKLIFDSCFDDLHQKRILSIITEYCHNIEVIHLDRVEKSVARVFSKLLTVNKKLHSISCFHADNIIQNLPLRDWKSLHIGLMNIDTLWDEEMASLITSSPSLEKFHVNYWTPNMTAAISNCGQLKTLYFPTWTEEAAYKLMRDTALLNRLTSLKIVGPEDDDDLIVNLLRRCSNLESLGLFYYYDEHLPIAVEQTLLALPKLKSLDLDASSINDKILSRLIKFKHLRIGGHSESITDEGIFKMIKNSTSLEKLEIPKLGVTPKLFGRLVRETRGRRQILTIEVSHKIYEEAFKLCKGSKIDVVEELETFESLVEHCRI